MTFELYLDILWYPDPIMILLDSYPLSYAH